MPWRLLPRPWKGLGRSLHSAYCIAQSTKQERDEAWSNYEQDGTVRQVIPLEDASPLKCSAVPHQQTNITLNAEFRSDLIWWRTFLLECTRISFLAGQGMVGTGSSWNGVLSHRPYSTSIAEKELRTSTYSGMRSLGNMFVNTKSSITAKIIRLLTFQNMQSKRHDALAKVPSVHRSLLQLQPVSNMTSCAIIQSLFPHHTSLC